MYQKKTIVRNQPPPPYLTKSPGQEASIVGRNQYGSITPNFTRQTPKETKTPPPPNVPKRHPEYALEKKQAIHNANPQTLAPSQFPNLTKN